MINHINIYRQWLLRITRTFIYNWGVVEIDNWVQRYFTGQTVVYKAKVNILVMSKSRKLIRKEALFYLWPLGLYSCYQDKWRTNSPWWVRGVTFIITYEHSLMSEIFTKGNWEKVIYAKLCGGKMMASFLLASLPRHGYFGFSCKSQAKENAEEADLCQTRVAVGRPCTENVPFL